MSSAFKDFHGFLVERWHIPLEPGHYCDLAALLGMIAVSAFYSVCQAGMSAVWLPDAARLFAVLLSFHVFVLAGRCREGIEFRRGVFLVLPALLWLAADWLFFSEKPWAAEVNLISAITAASLFWICLYHLRHSWLKWIVTGVWVLVACLLASLAWGEERVVAELFLGRKISLNYGGMFCGLSGNPAAAGALLLPAFFSACAVALARNRMLWARLLAGYAGAVLLFGIYMTHHVGVWLGCLVGTVILSALVLARTTSRIGLVLLTVGVFAWFSPRMNTNVGVLFSQPSPTIEGVSGNPVVLKAPLAYAALKAVASSPVYGLGSGGFEVFFEKYRPAGCRTSPVTPGSLPLALLTEYGIVGFLAVAVPACWLWFAGLQACLRLPIWEFSEKLSMRRRSRSGRKKYRLVYDPGHIVPEQRILFGGILAGTAATVVLLCIDYPGFMPAVLCGFAINGAILLSEIKRNPDILCAGVPMKKLFLAGVVLKPAGWLLWVLAPLTSASLAERAGEVVNKFLPTPEDPALGYRLDFGKERLAAAGDEARRAVYYNPQNAEALAVFAKSALRLSALRPEQSDTLGSEALAAVSRACEIEPKNADFLLVRGAALYMRGDTQGAFEQFREALEVAPRNLPVLLTAGDFFTLQSAMHAEAFAVFDKAVSLYPKNEYAHRRRSFLSQVGAMNEPEVKK